MHPVLCFLPKKIHFRSKSQILASLHSLTLKKKKKKKQKKKEQVTAQRGCGSSEGFNKLKRFIRPRWAIVFKSELYEAETSENGIKLLFHSKLESFYVKHLSISLHLPLCCVILTFSVPSKTHMEYRMEIGNSGFATAQKTHLYVNTI